MDNRPLVTPVGVRSQRGIVLRIVVLLAFASCPRAFALNAALDITQYAHTSWTREGISKGMVYAIAQTADGFIWLGTNLGLLRFDGVRTVPWQAPSDQPLPSDRIEALLAARDGTLWIGTLKGLGSWKDGRLRVYPELAGLLVVALHQDHQGTVWAGGFAYTPPGKLCAIRDDTVTCYGEDGFFRNGVLGLIEDSKGTLWAGGWTGFWRWQPGPSRFYPLSSKPNDYQEPNGIQQFAEDGDGSLLMPLRGRVARFADGSIKTAYPFPRSAQQVHAEHILRDRDGGLWVGTEGHGLLHIHQGGSDSYSESQGLSGNRVSALFEDREGSVWVATNKGLDRFRAYTVTRFGERQGISLGAIHAVAARDGSLWWLTADRHVNRWDRGPGADGRVHNVTVADLPKHDQAYLFEDNDGRMWVAATGGVGYLRADRFVPVNAPGGLVWAMAADARGNLWISNFDRGLLHVFRDELVQQIPWDVLGGKDLATALAADNSDGGVWLGFSQGGVAYLRDGQIRASYTAANGLGAGRVSDLRLDHDGALWAATDNGLSRLKDGRVATLSTNDGLPCNRVGWVVEAEDHALWLYAACGLIRIARTEIDNWAAGGTGPGRAIQTIVLDDHDGVEPLAVRGSYAGPKASVFPDGTIWFVTADGLNTIDPRRLRLNTAPVPVRIEQLTSDGKAFDAGQGLRLPPRAHALTIAYTALSFVAPERILFRYKLEGFDQEWQDVGNRRQAYYTNLPPGNYRFRVVARNDSGVWNTADTAVAFAIAPAYYQTMWFRSLLALAAAALLWAAYRYRLLQLAHAFDVQLQGRVDERTRIARDLHDTLLQSFHGLLFRFKAVNNMLPDRPTDAKQKLESAINQAAQALTEGRNTVQNLREPGADGEDLALAITTLGRELANADGDRGGAKPAVTVGVHGTPQALRPVLRDDVYRIAAEALRNAFRHAHARHVEVEIRYDEKQLQLRVRDDGRGIEPNVLEDRSARHFGLPGMRERADLIGAHLDVWTQAGIGTEVELRVPGHAAYEAQQRIRLWPARRPIGRPS